MENQLDLGTFYKFLHRLYMLTFFHSFFKEAAGHAFPPEGPLFLRRFFQIASFPGKGMVWSMTLPRQTRLRPLSGGSRMSASARFRFREKR